MEQFNTFCCFLRHKKKNILSFIIFWYFFFSKRVYICPHDIAFRIVKIYIIFRRQFNCVSNEERVMDRVKFLWGKRSEVSFPIIFSKDFFQGNQRQRTEEFKVSTSFSSRKSLFIYLFEYTNSKKYTKAIAFSYVKEREYIMTSSHMIKACSVDSGLKVNFLSLNLFFSQSFRRSLKFHSKCKHSVIWIYTPDHQTFAFAMIFQ